MSSANNNIAWYVNGKQGNLRAGSPKRQKSAPAILPFFCLLVLPPQAPRVVRFRAQL
jgi:hypothetical protein